ncbi:E3 ubiquitin-protein ligase SHPRH-like isoform X2 [Patiria miniata]|uniref:E3 ubiquitin-protein ligase SHPRH n=1 Tax=Patiria miniata TaxID=46514 RepID=A0A914BP94_PATMI|nr:E3 ubiquitin-protein ligase SHPRH-like isoform X2 [Patiria miniata]
MSKRKNKAPVQLNQSKRSLLTWNMNEGNQLEASTSYSAIQTPLDRSETFDTTCGPSSAAVQGNLKKLGHGFSESESVAEQIDASSKAPPHHITISVYETIWEEANYSITVHEQRPQDNVACQLGLITLALSPHGLSKSSELTSLELTAGDLDCRERDVVTHDTLPKQIPRGRCSLFISPTRPHHLVFDYAPDNVENAPNGLSSRVYLCLEAAIVHKPPDNFLDSLEKLIHHHKSKVKLIRHAYNAVTGQLSLAICLLQPALTVPKFASEPARRQDYAHHMQSLMHWLHGYQAPAPREAVTSKRHDFNQLFDAVRRRHSQNGDHAIVTTIQLQHPCLVPTLREYQRQAVSWMLRKERFGETEGEEPAEDSGRLHCMWSELKLAEQTLYYNCHSGQFTRQRFIQPLPFPGGILADEMGLGKTVEVLACILSHPRYPAQPTMNQTDKASKEAEGGSDPTSGIMGTGDDNTECPREKVTETGISDIGCLLPESAAQEEAQDVVSKGKELGTDTKVKATNPGVGEVPEPMDQTERGTSVEAEGAKLEIPHSTDEDNIGAEGNRQISGSEIVEQETDAKSDAKIPRVIPELMEQSVEEPSHKAKGTKLEIPKPTDFGRDDVQPDLSKISQDSSAVEVMGVSLGTDSDRAASVLSFEITKTQSSTYQMQAFATKSVDTNTPHLLSDTQTEPKPEHTADLIKAEPVSLSTSLDDNPSGSQQLIPPERWFESKIPQTAEIELLAQETKQHSNENESGSHSPPVVKEEGRAVLVRDAERTVDPDSSAPSEPSGTSPPSELPTTEATSEPETNTQPTQDTNKPAKKPKKKQAAKQPLPNPYLRPKSRERPKFRFECICGVVEEELDPEWSIQCQICDGWQHCRCVNYSKLALVDDRYLCPMCCIEQPTVPSGATLIISPSTICHQWIDEINRHIQTQTLNILVYQGVKKHGFLQPQMLAEHDIVITTYDTLRTELNYVDLPHTNSDNGRRLRHAKRYMAVPSPLPAVEWWRVCLDEAQMVECPTAKVAEMALRLTAVNRWCVTGTPIQRDLDNLYGLFLFLGVEPYWVKSWWDNILYKPYLHGNQEPMEKALAEVLWRSAKKDVIHQINIPAQTEQTHWLQFSPIETHFYKRKQEHCSKDLLQAAARLKIDVSTRLGSLARATVHRLMNPLLRLRQACCHPQAVRGEFISMQRTTLTMAELLTSLTLKAKTESEEAHRQLVCSLNGLGAVCIIKGQTLDAIEHYRDILRSVEEHKDRLKTDSLQRLHTMHNLHQLLKLKPEGLVPTLRDGELEQQVQEIRDAYLAKAEAALQSSFDSLLPLQEKIQELKDELPVQNPWWIEGLQYLRYVGVEEEFVDRVKDMLMSTTRMDSLSVANHFSTLHGLQMVLVTKLDDLNNAYKRLQAGMDQLNVDVTQELVAEATDCHLRPFGGKPKNRCPFCRVHTLFTDYETCLFSIKQRDLLSETDPDDEAETAGPRLQGSWAASETERILRALLASLRQQGGDEEMLEEGGAHLEMMETQKKEFKSLRVTWTMLCERVAAWDELKMATMRLRLREAHEPEEVLAQANVIEPGQLDHQRLKLLNDRALAQSELKKKLGQLVYLKSLDLPDGNNPEPCPICVKELGKQWSVLPCGHSFCNSCMDMMRVHRGGHRKNLRCAICRAVTSLQEISFVSTEQNNQQPGSTISVKGGYSTKVEAVVQTLLQLREQDTNVKAIVFSTWVDVLTVIAKALKDNKVEFRSIGSHGERHFKANLLDFKQEDGVTALLLPVHSGSKGLNIIEATHVLLVEPILNPASELQAVGRVHRIGQTRPTFVHRFLVRDTIEERLHAFLQANHTSDSLNNLEGETGALTLQNLKQLFTEDSREPDGAASDDSWDLTDDEYV